MYTSLPEGKNNVHIKVIQMVEVDEEPVTAIPHAVGGAVGPTAMCAVPVVSWWLSWLSPGGRCVWQLRRLRPPGLEHTSSVPK